MPASATARPRGKRERAAGFGSCTSTSSARSSFIRSPPSRFTFSAPPCSIAWGSCPPSATRSPVLSNIYTQTLGQWALWLFYVGAVVTLYGTVFASTAANARLFADAFRIAGFYERGDAVSRLRWRNRFIVILSVIPVTFYWFLRSPVQMVVAGGLAQALMLPLIGIAVIYLRHTKVPKDIQPAAATTVLLWISTAVMAAFAGYYVWSRL